MSVPVTAAETMDIVIGKLASLRDGNSIGFGLRQSQAFDVELPGIANEYCVPELRRTFAGAG